MMCKEKGQKKRGRAWLWLALCLLLALGVACAAYLGSYYHAQDAAAFALAGGGSYAVEQRDGALIFQPEESMAGLIFYPGGKVEHTAYAPLMAAFAERGVLCVLLEVPFRLAVLDMDAAEGWQARFPEITRWYVGGHSLGGAMAASYVSKHALEYEGLLLLGAYSTADLSDSSLRVLSIYGSEDQVMDREKYAQCLAHLPGDYKELVIEGGCHALFGDYGVQRGDGTPTISPARQCRITADFLAAQIC